MLIRGSLILGSILLQLALPTGVHAVQPKIWKTAGVAGFGRTDRDSLSVTSEGFLELGLARQKTDLEVTSVWALERDDEGVWVASGDGGGVFRLNAGGDISVEASVIQPQVTALGRDSEGNLWVGTAPDGVLYRWRDASLEVMADTPETYIWAIAPHSGGGVVFATGERGKLYRLGADHKVTLLADLDVTHVTGLATAGTSWIVTTDSPARLVRVSEDGSFSVLVEGDESEFRSPVLRPNGDISFLANSTDGAGRVYIYSSGGRSELLWSMEKHTVYELQVDEQDVLWFVGGADEGRGSLYKMIRREWVEVLTVPEAQATAFVLDESGPRWIAGGTPGRIYAIPGDVAPSGTAVSEVYDAGAPATWGAIAMEPGPAQPGVRLETRTGNSKKPGSAWEAWSPVDLEESSGAIPSGPARYIQWRLTMTRSDVRVGGVRVAYVQTNQPPTVHSVSVSELGAELHLPPNQMNAPGVYQELPGGLRVEFQKANGGSIPQAPAADVAWARRFRTITWKAEDPNQDPLRFKLQIRSLESEAWLLVSDELESSPYVWDSSTSPDGWYQVRLEASDESANPPGNAFHGEDTTEPFLVDNTRPEIEALRIQRNQLEGMARDAMSPIRELEFAVDGGPWRQLFPRDGVPDQPTEAFRLPLEFLESGSHVIQVRAIDIAGNVGVGHAAAVRP